MYEGIEATNEDEDSEDRQKSLLDQLSGLTGDLVEE